MDLAGLKEVSRRKMGANLIISFIGEGCDSRSALYRLIRELPVGAELSAIEVGPAECSHELKATTAGLELKRVCHGAYGTWRPCTSEEALEWLLPGLEAATSNLRIGACTLSMFEHG